MWWFVLCANVLQNTPIWGLAMRLALKPAPGRRSHGLLKVGERCVCCEIGRAGLGVKSHEGDGKTPRGTMKVIRGWFRADRMCRPRTRLPMAPMRPDDGWCDAPGHRLYNRAVRLPFSASHEAMWRKDRLYDVVIELDFNRRPRVQGRGSAIFLHLSRPDRGPTAGCIAVSAGTMRRLLPLLAAGQAIVSG